MLFSLLVILVYINYLLLFIVVYNKYLLLNKILKLFLKLRILY